MCQQQQEDSKVQLQHQGLLNAGSPKLGWLGFLGTAGALHHIAEPGCGFPRWLQLKDFLQPLSCNIASSPTTVSFWSGLPPHNTGCRLTQRAEIGRLGSWERSCREGSPYLGRTEAWGWEESSWELGGSLINEQWNLVNDGNGEWQNCCC